MKTLFATLFLLFILFGAQAQPIEQVIHTATIGGKVIAPRAGSDTTHSLISIGNYAVMHITDTAFFNPNNDSVRTWIGYLSPDSFRYTPPPPLSIIPKVQIGKPILFPNPGSNQFVIKFAFSPIKFNEEGLIVDASGKVLSKVSLINNSENEWSFLTDLPKGTYFLNLGNSIKSNRFIVE